MVLNRRLLLPVGILLPLTALAFACTTSAPAASAPPVPTADADADAAPACAAVALSSAVPIEALAEPSDADRCTWHSFFDSFPNDRVICSGEGSHGTDEATLAHLDIAHELVLTRGYRMLALEVDDASAALYSKFVEDGDEAALKTVFNDSKETLASTKQWERFFRGLRDIRQALPPSEHLAVRGMDVAIAPAATRDRLFAYLHLVDETTAAAYEAKIPRTVTKSSAASAASAAVELRGIVESKNADYSAKAPEGYDTAVIDVRALDEGYHFSVFYLNGDFTTGNATLRDPAMARSLISLAETGKVMVIAHEAHCAHDTPSQGTARAAGTFAFGKAVTAALGPSYVVVGHLFADGKELAPDGSIRAVTSLPNSLQHALASATDSKTAVMRTSSYDTLDLTKDWPIDRFEEVTSPARQLDGFVWIRTISPARFW